MQTAHKNRKCLSKATAVFPRRSALACIALALFSLIGAVSFSATAQQTGEKTFASPGEAATALDRLADRLKELRADPIP